MTQQPKATATATSTVPPTRDDTPWPNTMPASSSLFVARASWPIPPNVNEVASTNFFVSRASWPIPPNVNEVSTPTFVKTEKTPPKQVAIPHTLILNKPQNSKPAEEACGWGPQYPICTQSNPNMKVEDSEDDWNGNRNYYSQMPKYSPFYDFPDRLSHNYKTEKDRNERLEFLNDKYNLDYYSDSDSDSNSEHEYETLV